MPISRVYLENFRLFKKKDLNLSENKVFIQGKNGSGKTSILESIELLSTSSKVFAKDCVAGITADSKKCESYIEESLAMCTSLAPVIGYDKAAAVAKKAFAEGKTVREIVYEENILEKRKADDILNPKKMVKPSL